MLRPLAVMLSLVSGAAGAACTGPSLIDRLSPVQRVEMAEAVAATPHAEGLVWTATRGADVLTIVGTMHLYDPRHAALHDRLDDHLATQDLLLVEATAAEEASLQEAMLADPSLMFITEGPTLPEMLDDATWDALVAAMRARGMLPVIGSRMQPWFLMMSLAMPPCAMDDVLAGRSGLDHLLIDSAGAAGVPVQALEPWDTLFRLMDGFSRAEQIEMLKTGLMDPATQQALFVAMLDGYFAGRIAEIWEIGRLALDFMPGLDPATAAEVFQLTEDLLLADRNRAWMPVIAGAVAQHDRVMIAAGAAHLPGEAGVLNLLAQAGWTVSPGL